MKKHLYMYTIIATVLIIISLTLRAATEQWRYDGWHIIYQVAADGTGGCAIYRITTNGSASVVWIDKNGQAKYDRVMDQVPLISPIIYCNKKNGLAFVTFSTGPTNKVLEMIMVDKKLNESATTTPGRHIVPGSYPYGSTGTSTFDKKGFFVTEMATNGVGATLVRYTYK
jgi:hypothetical protein